MLTNEALREVSYAEFAMKFYVGRDELIKRVRGGKNRVVNFRPQNSSDPRGERCPDYCRKSLVRYRPWQSCYANGWGGAEGDVADTDEVAKRRAKVHTWTAFAERTLILLYAQRPPGFSTVDLRPATRRLRHRRRRRVQGKTGDGGREESDGSNCSWESESEEDEPNLDGAYGDSRVQPGDLAERRRWHDSADHDWGRNNWVGQADVPQEAETWVTQMHRPGPDALASAISSIGPPLNAKQAHAVNIVRQHDVKLQAYRLQRNRQGEELGHERVNAPALLV